MSVKSVVIGLLPKLTLFTTVFVGGKTYLIRVNEPKSSVLTPSIFSIDA